MKEEKVRLAAEVAELLKKAEAVDEEEDQRLYISKFPIRICFINDGNVYNSPCF
jgi:hypothetical protein